MLMRQVELADPTNARKIAWIDREHAIVGRKMTLNLGDNERSEWLTVVQAWTVERDLDEIQTRQENRRTFGGSIR